MEGGKQDDGDTVETQGTAEKIEDVKSNTATTFGPQIPQRQTKV